MFIVVKKVILMGQLKILYIFYINIMFFIFGVCWIDYNCVMGIIYNKFNNKVVL